MGHPSWLKLVAPISFGGIQALRVSYSRPPYSYGMYPELWWSTPVHQTTGPPRRAMPLIYYLGVTGHGARVLRAQVLAQHKTLANFSRAFSPFPGIEAWGSWRHAPPPQDIRGSPEEVDEGGGSNHILGFRLLW